MQTLQLLATVRSSYCYYYYYYCSATKAFSVNKLLPGNCTEDCYYYYYKMNVTK